jgi:alkylhydroperoxidase family enzyme
MAVIDPVPIGEIENSDLAPLLEKARALHVPDDQFLQILAHAPGYAKANFDAFHESLAKGGVDHGLKEIIRIRLARLAGDDGYFGAMRSAQAVAAGLTEERIEAGCGDFETDPQFSDAEKWAIRYAAWMYTVPHKVNKAFYDEGKRHYSEAQIMELGAFIAFHYGIQTFFATLKLTPQV